MAGGFTLIVTIDVSPSGMIVVGPPFKVTWKTYVPWINPVTGVETNVGCVILAVFGPEFCVHK